MFFDVSIDGSGLLDIVTPLGEMEGGEGTGSLGKAPSNVTPASDAGGVVTSSPMRGSEKQCLNSFLPRTLQRGRGVENTEKIEVMSSEESKSPSSDLNW